MSVICYESLIYLGNRSIQDIFSCNAMCALLWDIKMLIVRTYFVVFVIESTKPTRNLDIKGNFCNSEKPLLHSKTH